jgi:hypothetical protein
LDAPFAVIRVECGDALAVMRISDIGEALDWRLPAASWGSEKVIEMLSIQPRPDRSGARQTQTGGYRTGARRIVPVSETAAGSWPAAAMFLYDSRQCAQGLVGLP